MMKVLNNIEIIIIDKKIYYNYNGILYTKEQFEDTYFPKADTSSTPQKEIEDLFDDSISEKGYISRNPRAKKLAGIIYAYEHYDNYQYTSDE